MKDYFVSETTGKSYVPEDCVRIVNMLQLATYMAHGAELLDIYASRDVNTNVPRIVGIVSKAQTQELYKKWCNRELK